MLADHNKNPFDTKAAKMTFNDVHGNGQNASTLLYQNPMQKATQPLIRHVAVYNHKVFKDLKLVDLQTVIDTCGKNYPTLRKIKVLFNQLYDFAIKNDICNKDYSTFVDVVSYKDRNPNKYDQNKFRRKKSDRYGNRKMISTIKSY